MRRKPPPAINPQMYRHFAALTVAITALLAFFANGENHEALAAAAVASAAPARPNAERPKPLARKPVERPRSWGSWGSDERDGFGEPMIRPAGGFVAWASTPPAPSAAHGTNLPGSLASDDGSENPSEPAPAAAGPSAAQIAAVAVASRLRSGARGND